MRKMQAKEFKMAQVKSVEPQIMDRGNGWLRKYNLDYKLEQESLNSERQTLSFAQDTFTVFYQSQKYFTGNKVKILKPKFDKVSDKILRYFVASFNVALDKLSWGIGSTVKSINSIKISLPMKNREIDFDFMEKFISDLEVERLNEIKNHHIDEISAYMSVIGSN